MQHHIARCGLCEACIIEHLGPGAHRMFGGPGYSGIENVAEREREGDGERDRERGRKGDGERERDG